jgi:hypothetical protein
VKRVFATTVLADVGHLKNLLEQDGIGCFIKHEQLSGGLGDLPFLDCQPELWVYADGDVPRAETLITEALRAAPMHGGTPWTCKHCGEANDPQFAVCWRCGASDRSG